MLYSLATFPILLLAFCLQEYLPRFGCQWHYSLFLLFPTCFLCASVTVAYPLMLLQAFLFGLAWDLRWVISPNERGLSDLTVGTSIALLGALGSMMQGIRPLYLRRRIIMPAMLVALCVFLLRVAEYLILNVKRSGFAFPPLLVREMASSSILSLIFAPLALLGLRSMAKALRYDVRLERT